MRPLQKEGGDPPPKGGGSFIIIFSILDLVPFSSRSQCHESSLFVQVSAAAHTLAPHLSFSVGFEVG